MPTPDDEIVLHPLTEARVCTIPNDPESVVLRMTSGTEETHYVMSREDFKGLARRFGLDARLI